ncbi:MAG TPA: hypothetical protein PLF50_06625 [Candidatus Cloacimonadota bacterium]|nr:hypothetical protein [Candidatus Cloacimonadota bacterium]
MKPISNGGTIALSIAIAIILWFSLNLFRTQETVTEFPVTYVNVPAKLAETSLPAKAKFLVKGKGISLLRLKFANLHAVCDASELTENSSAMKSNAYSLELPANYQVVVIKLLEEEISSSKSIVGKQVRINAVFEDEAAKSLFAKNSYRLSPEVAAVRGEKEKLDKITSLQTEPITLNMLSDKRKTINLIKPEGVSVSPETVTLITDFSDIQTKVISNLVISAPPQVNFLPKQAAIRISGKAEDIKQLNMNDIQVAIKPEENETTAPVIINLPEGIVLLDYTPRFVTIVPLHDKK